MSDNVNAEYKEGPGWHTLGTPHESRSELGSSTCAVHDRTRQTEDRAEKSTEAVVVYHDARVQSTNNENKTSVGKGRESNQRAVSFGRGYPGRQRRDSLAFRRTLLSRLVRLVTFSQDMYSTAFRPCHWPCIIWHRLTTTLSW